jgi:hypothetical protein
VSRPSSCLGNAAHGQERQQATHMVCPELQPLDAAQALLTKPVLESGNKRSQSCH